MNSTILKDGISYKFSAPVFSAVLCKLGVHAWKYWHMAPSFIEVLPKQANVCRNCERCGWMEMTDNGVDWRGRL